MNQRLVPCLNIALSAYANGEADTETIGSGRIRVPRSDQWATALAERQRQATLYLGSLHGEIEVFNARGKHLGAMDPVTGEMIKSAVPGRAIDV